VSIAAIEAVPLEPVPADRFQTAILRDWRDWLQQALEPDWRPSEWQPDLDLFNGRIDNPTTRVWECNIVGCSGLCTTEAACCSTCTNAFTASGLSWEEFLISHTPRPSRRMSVEERCVIERDGTDCGRQRHCQRLCLSHYSLWKSVTRRDMTLPEWIPLQKPYAALPACAVRGSSHDKTPSTSLCRKHQVEWAKYAKANRLVGTEEEHEVWRQQAVPSLAQNQFSLAPLSAVARMEILFVLQQRDARGQSLNPSSVRWAVRQLTGLASIALAEVALPAAETLSRGPNLVAFMRDTRSTLKVALDDFRGIDPKDKTVWDLAAAGIPSRFTATGRRRAAGTADFAQIRQPWLRRAALEWARATNPDSLVLMGRLRACVVASEALSLRSAGGHDASKLDFSDINAVVDAFRALNKPDNIPMTAKTRRGYLRAFFDVLDYGRAAGLLAGMGAGFARHSTHHIRDEESNEDELGKAIPESVIRQLDSQVESIGEGFPYGDFAEEDIRAMFQTAYIVLRDTGRRPREICELRDDCLEFDDGEYSLLWDNRKSRRLRRRLPITAQTVEAIKRWRKRRTGLDLPIGSERFLFPPRTAASGIPHLDTRTLYRALRAWVEALPAVDSEEVDEDGRQLPFDRTLIYPYAFRHSYAQRHADAGVPVDVLRELMDHAKIDMTMGYYKVSLKRKRQAVQTLRLHVVDRTGRSAPMPSNTAYEARSVAVPFGGCQEPSNVKAGGKACPIRFQCAGCGFYRPDPSYLPALEDHIRSLKADKETAEAMDVDDFVVRNLNDQITAFREVLTSMREGLQKLPPDERQRVEEASTVLRKVRAVDGRTVLPLSVVTRTEAAR
jgi:integrase